MNELSLWLFSGGTAVRTMILVALLLALGVAERVRPFRGDARPARRQWINFALILIDTLLLRLMFALLGAAFALDLAGRGIGLLNLVDWPPALELALAVIALDCAIYWQHRLFHVVPLLWRTHRVHHSDLAFDLTLGVRFHPFEMVLSQLYQLVVVALLGAPAMAVLIFKVVLPAGSLFTHTDIALPAKLDRALRWIVVTPNMHRIHHSLRREETMSNYGFHLSFWDRLFGSYRAAPVDDPQRMGIGLPALRERDDQSLAALLWQPFRNVPLWKR